MQWPKGLTYNTKGPTLPPHQCHGGCSHPHSYQAKAVERKETSLARPTTLKKVPDRVPKPLGQLFQHIWQFGSPSHRVLIPVRDPTGCLVCEAIFSARTTTPRGTHSVTQSFRFVSHFEKFMPLASNPPPHSHHCCLPMENNVEALRRKQMRAAWSERVNRTN